MIAYNTGVQNRQPIPPAMQQQALMGLYAQWAHPSVNMDVYNARAQAAGVDMERAAAKANNDYLMRAQEAQQAMALKGAGLIAQQNDNQRGMASKIAGGVNGLLSGLFVP